MDSGVCMMIDRVDILGTRISATNLDECLEMLQSKKAEIRGQYICAANVHTTVYAKEHPAYQKIQNNSLMTLPDGKPLSIVGRKKGFPHMERITGPDFMEAVLSVSEKNQWSHYFYGNTSENIQLLCANIKTKYPNLKIVGCEPSVYRPLTEEEEKTLIHRISAAAPDFVWVGLGAPIQEQFCAKLACETKSLWIGVGGAFNIIAGVIPRAPEWMQRCCLEWLYRLLKEPRRLFKRYLISNSKFVWYLVNEKRSQ